MPPKRQGFSKDELQELRSLDAEMKRLLRTFEGIGFNDFVRYLGSKRKIFLTNFVAGMAKGLGIIIGMTVVVAVLIWLLSYMVDFPLIGQYLKEFKMLLETVGPGQ
ncbi:MAG TPA: DUF5665 domain-containing protein [Candidatus Gracilibacteria bacterium]